MYSRGTFVNIFNCGYATGFGIVTGRLKYSRGKQFYEVKLCRGRYCGQVVWQAEIDLRK